MTTIIKNTLSSKNILILMLVACFIFLFGLRAQITESFPISPFFYNFIQARHLIFLLLFPSFFLILQDIKNKNYKFLRYITMLGSFIIAHSIINIFFDKSIITYSTFLGIVLLLMLFTVAYYYNEIINDNLNSIINIFFLFFFTSTILSFFNYKSDAPFFCGGIPDFIGLNTENIIPYRLPDVRLSFKEFIFLENSHLGMIAPGVLAFSFFKIIDIKSNNYFKFFTIIFFIICILKSSTTLLIGILISFSVIIFFNFKVLSKKLITTYSLIILGTIIILATNAECTSRINIDKLNFFKVVGKYNETKIKKFFGYDKENRLVYIEKIAPILLYIDEGPKNDNPNISNDYVNKKFVKTKGNLSSQIYNHSFEILRVSIFDRPFGWGLNRYDKAYRHYNKIVSIEDRSYVTGMNTKDGANNLVKILVEFGVFGLCFYFLVLLFMINRFIPLEHKLFYGSLIITQSIRAAGYYNGGFALIAFLMIFSYIKTVKK